MAGTHTFVVKVPEFKVYFVENGRTKFSFPVVVGKKELANSQFFLLKKWKYGWVLNSPPLEMFPRINHGQRKGERDFPKIY